MEFRRHAPHDVRRRRLLTDDVSPAEEAAPEAGEGKSRKAAKSEARAEAWPRIIDLVPRRASSFVLLFLTGVLVIAGLEAAYWFMPKLGPLTTDGTVEAFDLDGEGTLAVWFSSFLLTLAGFGALIIYSIGRRREEDYHARYRVWLWAALCWFTLSIDETGSLHEGFKEVMSYLTGSRLMGDGSLWWVIAYSLVLGQLGLMLWMETKGSWGARVALICTAVCFAAAVAAQLELCTQQVGVRIGIMIEEGCEMLGDLFLLLGMGLHARFAIRSLSEGKRARKEAAKTKTRAAKAKAASAAAEPAAKPVRESKPAAAASSTPKPAAAPAKPAASIGKPAAPVSKPAAPAAAPLPAKPLNVSSASSAGASSPRVEAPKPNGSSAPNSSSAAGQTTRIDEADGRPDGTHRKLSKAERKALRREQRGGRGGGDDFDDE